MLTLSHSDLHALNQVIGDIYTARDLETFYQTAFASIQRIIPCEIISFNETIPSIKQVSRISFNSRQYESSSQKLLAVFKELAPEHPLTPYVFSGNVIKISDYLPCTEFKNTGIYSEYYRYLETEAQIAFAIPVASDRVTLLALSRKYLDFTERDRLVLTLLRTHLIAALQHAVELEQMQAGRKQLCTGTKDKQQGVLLFDAAGTVIGISEYAGEMLEKYFSIRTAAGYCLPDSFLQILCDRMQCTLASAAFKRAVESPPVSFCKEGFRLDVRLVADELTSDLILLVSEIPDPAEQIKQLGKYGLSSRESQVLFWLAQGKSNTEIAIVLGMSRRTAEKHVERIFDKLGVTNRSGATAMVRKEIN